MAYLLYTSHSTSSVLAFARAMAHPRQDMVRRLLSVAASVDSIRRIGDDLPTDPLVVGNA